MEPWWIFIGLWLDGIVMYAFGNWIGQRVAEQRVRASIFDEWAKLDEIERMTRQ